MGSEEEKIQMINLFKPSVPKAREDMPALKIMMLRPGARSEDDLFVHDTLYNIVVLDNGGTLLMDCWTGDMHLTVMARSAEIRQRAGPLSHSTRQLAKPAWTSAEV